MPATSSAKTRFALLPRDDSYPPLTFNLPFGAKGLRTRVIAGAPFRAASGLKKPCEPSHERPIRLSRSAKARSAL